MANIISQAHFTSFIAQYKAFLPFLPDMILQGISRCDIAIACHCIAYPIYSCPLPPCRCDIAIFSPLLNLPLQDLTTRIYSFLFRPKLIAPVLQSMNFPFKSFFPIKRVKILFSSISIRSPCMLQVQRKKGHASAIFDRL